MTPRKKNTLTASSLAASTLAMILAGVTGLLLPDLQPVAMAQTGPAKPADSAPASKNDLANTFDVDVLYVLASPEVTIDKIDDPVWLISPGIGKRLVQIPIKINTNKIKDEVKFDASTFRLRGGVFVCYRLGNASDRGPASTGSQGDRLAEGNLPQDAPWITRRLSLFPSGKITWPMERNIYGADVKDQDKLYNLALKRELLEKKSPGNPPRTVKQQGESAQAFYQRRTEEDMRYSNMMREYRDLGKQVRELPDSFEADIPNRIWLVFDVSGMTKEFFLDGPAPLPWSMTFDQFNTIRDAVQRPVVPEADANGSVRFRQDLITQITAYHTIMLNDKEQPYNARAAAYALVLLKLAPHMKTGDPIFNLYDEILRSKDTQASRAAIKDLATTLPPTQATTALIKRAGTALDAETQGKIWSSVVDSFNKDSMASIGMELIKSANETLRTGDAESTGQFLDQIISSATLKPELTPLLISGIQFESLPDKRLEDAIIKVVENSPTNKLALGWLNQRLLGSVDQKVVRKTLEVINSADVGNRMVTAMADTALKSVFGTPVAPGDSQTTTIRLDKPIPILSPNDAIFRVLQAGDPKIRTLAWDALPRFGVTAVAPGDSPESAGDETRQRTITESTYRQLQDIAFSQNPTPPQLVDFLVRQDNPAIAATMLVAVVLKGSERASIAATRALMASKGTYPLDAYLLQLSYGDRQGFAKRIYENRLGYDPLITPLMRQRIENNPLVSWFGREVSRGVLPPVNTWAAQANEGTLLEATVSQEGDLAMAATAALVYGAGGDDRMIRDLTQKFRHAPDQTPVGLKAVWLEGKRTINAARLAKVAGNYKLSLKVGTATPSVDAPPADPITDIDLGVVNLQVNGTDVALSTKSLTLASLEIYAIGLENPSEFKNFKNDALAKLPLEGATKAIDLIGQKDGSFVGKFALPSNQEAQVIFSPVQAQVQPAIAPAVAPVPAP